MTPLLLIPILVAAVGTDLGLALLVLGLLFTWGAAPPALVGLAGLATPWVLAAALVFWLLETVLEQVSATVLALWHTAQVVARPVAALLLAGAVVPPGRPFVEVGVPVAAAVLTLGVHAGAVGWLAFLHLGSLPRRTRWVASFAEDAAVVALLALGLDHPVPALALLALLTLGAPRHHLTSLAGFQLLLRGVVGDARGLLGQGGWSSGDAVPRWVQRALELPDDGGETDIRGSPAALHGPDPSRLRYGWLAVTRGRSAFVARPGGALSLGGDGAVEVEAGRIATRVALGDGRTLYLPPDGPAPSELAGTFGGPT